MNRENTALVKSGIHVPTMKRNNVFRLLCALGVAGIVTSLISQTEEERIQMGQEYVIDPLARIVQGIDLNYRESMNQSHPGYMPITPVQQDQ